MHASVGQLLSFRDGDALEAQLERHIVECPHCRSALGDLGALRNGLRDLGELTPPDRAWDRIRAKGPAASASCPSTARLSPWAIGIAACVTLAVGVVLTMGRQERGELPAPHQQVSKPSGDSRPAHEQLLAQSRAMEDFLRALPARPQVVRVGTAATIAQLEDRIRLVDYQLNLQSEIGVTQSQSQRLWETRVDLLNSLLNVRYVEAQRRVY